MRLAADVSSPTIEVKPIPAARPGHKKSAEAFVRRAACPVCNSTVLSPSQLGEMRFDFINSEQLFEHLPAPSAQLQTLAKSLKPDGVIRVGVPHAHDVKYRLALWDWTAADGTAKSLNAVAPLQHINCYSGRSLATLGAQAGLREINISSCRSDVRRATDIARVLIRPFYQRLLPRMAAIRRLQSGTLCFTPG